MKPKIKFVMLQLKLGGGNKVFVELAKVLNGLGFDCELIVGATKHHDSLKTDSIVTSKVGYRSTNILSRMLSLFALLRKLFFAERHDVYVFSDPFVALLMLLVPSKRMMRFIQADDYRLFDGNRKFPQFLLSIYHFLMQISFLKRNVTMIFNSQFVYQQYRKRGPSLQKARFVYPGIDHKDFFCETNAVRISDSIAVLAREEPVKGLKVVEDALEILKSQGHFVKLAKISYFGTRLLASRHPELEHVQTSSSCPNRYVLSRTDMFVFPSLREGFGLPPLEAMACGCAVIASDCGGVREYGKHNDNLLFFTAGDARDLASKLVSLIEDKETKEKIRQAGLETAAQYSWKNAGAALKKHLSECFNL